jgi:hypothetical protein
MGKSGAVLDSPVEINSGAVPQLWEDADSVFKPDYLPTTRK